MNVDNYADVKTEDLKEEILRLKKEKNAVILGHYYQKGEIQDLADFIGDSLALAQIATKLTQPVVVMCGVHFMERLSRFCARRRRCLCRISMPDAPLPTVVLRGSSRRLSTLTPVTQ